MTCDHRATRWVDGGTDDWTGERFDPVEQSYSTCEDIDVGRFRCTQCGKVEEFRDERLERMTTIVAESRGFARQRHRLVIQA